MPPPVGRICDWCASPATEAIEILSKDEEIGTGLLVYGCQRHKQTAFDSVHGRRKTLRKKRTQDTQLLDVSTLPRVE